VTTSLLRRPGRAATALALGVAMACAPGAAPEAHAAEPRSTEPRSEPDKLVCADAYRSGQTRRKSGALRRAREALVICASDRCPAVMHPDCIRWLTEVEAALPTISFAAKGESGKDITEVRVFVDGEAVATRLDGKALEIDPGAHTVQFERDGKPTLEQTIVVREGEKARVVSASWAASPDGAAEGEEAVAVQPSRAPAAAWIFGATGLAGIGAFGVLALTGMERRRSLEQSCFGTCNQADIDAVKTQFLVADVALGVGVVSLGVATYLLLATGGRSAEKPAGAEASRAVRTRDVSFGVAPRPGGGAVGLTGRF
jgi:hypothetical protein